MSWKLGDLGKTKGGEYFALTNLSIGDGLSVRVGPSEFAEDVVTAANLVDSAPEMLEALEALLANGGTTPGEWMPMKQIQQAREAIAKAKVTT